MSRAEGRSLPAVAACAANLFQVVAASKSGKYWNKDLFLTLNMDEKGTVRSDVEERVAEERLAWNDKNIPAWPKNFSFL